MALQLLRKRGRRCFYSSKLPLLVSRRTIPHSEIWRSLIGEIHLSGCRWTTGLSQGCRSALREACSLARLYCVNSTLFLRPFPFSVEGLLLCGSCHQASGFPRRAPRKAARIWAALSSGRMTLIRLRLSSGSKALPPATQCPCAA